MVFGAENLGRILYMSTIFSIHFSITASLNTIFPEMSDQKGYERVGQLTIMIMFLVEILGNIYGLNIISLKRSGLSFFACGLIPIMAFIPAIILEQCRDKEGYCSYTYITILSCVGYGFQGLGLGLYFLALNCYQSACTNVNSRDLLNGLSFTIVGMTYLIGYSYSTPLIVYLGRQKYFIVLAIAQFTVNLFFLFLPNPAKQATLQESTYNQVNDTQQMEQNSIEISPTTYLINPQTITVQEVYLQQEGGSLQAIILQMRQPAVKKLMPYFFLTGIVLGFEFGQFYQVIRQCLPEDLDQVIVNQKTFIVFLFFGAGEIISGPLVVLFRGKVELSNYLKLYTYLTGFTVILTGVNFFLKSYELCFAIALFWGIIDNFGQSTSNMIISSQWGENFPLFALYLVMQDIGAIIYQMIAIFLPYQLIIYALASIIVIQMVTLISTQSYIKRFYKKEKVTITNQ